jgi:hypothetical protein
VDDIEDVISVVDQTDVSTDDDVAVVSGAGRQALEKLMRYRTNSMAQVPVEHFALPKSGFEFRGQPVTVSKSLGETVMVFVVPTTRRLTIMIVEPSVVAVPIALVFLRKGSAAGEG